MDRFDLTTRGVVAMAGILTVVVAVWHDPNQPLWLVLAFLAGSAWIHGLTDFLINAITSATDWLTGGLLYAREVLCRWRKVTNDFAREWLWGRFSY